MSGTNCYSYLGISCYLKSVFFTGAITGYAAGYTDLGEEVIILKTINAGITWTPCSFSFPCGLSSIYFPDSTTGIMLQGVMKQS